MTDNYICSVYKNPKISICDENNYKSIRTTDDVKLGELLIIEHTFTNDPHICVSIIAHNEYLFNIYHPRTTKWADTSHEERIKMAHDKYTHNCFGFDKQNIITDIITKINHSCTPTCFVYINNYYTIQTTATVFIELYAIQDISKDTEITISYGPDTGHKRDFVCNCGKSLEERTKRFEIGYKIVKFLSHNNNGHNKEQLRAYLKTVVAKKILFYHYLSNKGIFMNDHKIISYTTNGEKLINDLVYKFLGINPDQLANETVKLAQTQSKIELFMNIIRRDLFNERDDSTNEVNTVIEQMVN